MPVIHPAPDYVFVTFLPPEEGREVGGIIRIDPGSDMVTCTMVRLGEDVPKVYREAEVIYTRKNSLNHIVDGYFCVHHNSIIAFR